MSLVNSQAADSNAFQRAAKPVIDDDFILASLWAVVGIALTLIVAVNGMPIAA